MIEINNQTKGRQDKQCIQDILENVLQKEGRGGANVSVALVEPAEAQRLNLQYRKKDYVPNILSFPKIGDGLGELVLCPEQIRREAELRQVPYRQELTRMLVHGALHLFGLTHEAMEKKEQNYLVLFGPLFRKGVQPPKD